MYHFVEGYSLQVYSESAVLKYAEGIANGHQCEIEFVGRRSNAYTWSPNSIVNFNTRDTIHDMAYAAANYNAHRDFLVYFQGITAHELEYKPPAQPDPISTLELLQTIIALDKAHLIFTAPTQEVVDRIIVGRPKRNTWNLTWGGFQAKW